MLSEINEEIDLFKNKIVIFKRYKRKIRDEKESIRSLGRKKITEKINSMVNSGLKIS